MPKLIVMVGPPGSGKSTFSKKYVEEGFVYVNQDSQGKDHLHIFDIAILAGQNVIVDRMGFNKEQRSRYLSLAKEKGYNTQIFVLHQSYDTCLERVRARVDHPTIKDEKSARSALNLFFTKYERVEDAEADEVVRIWPEGDKPRVIIVDLDGTLCNVDHRIHFVRTDGKKDWKSFFQGLKDDKVNEWCKLIIDSIYSTFTDGIKTVLCSGRPDDYEKPTRKWLEDNRIKFQSLYMRHRGDRRQDNITKEQILDFEILTRYTPFFMIDDRSQVVEMWRRRGYTCLQCASGNF